MTFAHARMCVLCGQSVSFDALSGECVFLCCGVLAWRHGK